MSLESLEKRVTKVEHDVSDIKKHVTNHIPHLIDDVKKDLRHLYGKVKPLETKDLKIRGVQEFLTVVLKVIGILGGVIWTTVLILEKIGIFG